MELFIKTILHIAATEGRTQVVQWILGSGLPFDVNSQDKNGMDAYK